MLSSRENLLSLVAATVLFLSSKVIVWQVSTMSWAPRVRRLHSTMVLHRHHWRVHLHGFSIPYALQMPY